MFCRRGIKKRLAKIVSLTVLCKKMDKNMYQWNKNLKTWKIGNIIYISIVFSWQIEEAKVLSKKHDGKIIVGGPSAIFNRSKINFAEFQKETDFDVLGMQNPLATFTTRGCSRKCEFCAVPTIDGEFRELKNYKINPVICDNNFLVASKKHIEKVIDKIKHFAKVDFNQGLDARLINDWHFDQFCRLKDIKLRFAFDSIQYESCVIDAITKAKRLGFKDIGVYVLIGFNDTPGDAFYRLEKIRKYGIRPNVMRYQPLDAHYKNGFVAENWTEIELTRMTRYYSRLRWLEHIPFEHYKKADDATADLFELAHTQY